MLGNHHSYMTTSSLKPAKIAISMRMQFNEFGKDVSYVTIIKKSDDLFICLWLKVELPNIYIYIKNVFWKKYCKPGQKKVKNHLEFPSKIFFIKCTVVKLSSPLIQIFILDFFSFFYILKRLLERKAPPKKIMKSW